MKKFSFLFLTFSLLCLVGCKPRTDDPTAEDALLEVESTTLRVGKEAQTITLNVVSLASFEVGRTDEWWCDATSTKMFADGEKIHYRVSIGVRENTTAVVRESHFDLRCGSLIKHMSVIQDSLSKGVDPGPDPQEPETAVEFAMSMAPGWNLGNNLDAVVNGVSNETSWGNGKCTQQTMNKVRAAGFRSVRIPVSWVGHIGAAPNYTIQESWMNRVAEVVGYAHSAGLKVIINIHHDGNPDVVGKNYWLDLKKAMTDEAYNTQVKMEIAAVWTQIANRFADEGSYLVFEDLNEITDGEPHAPGSKSQQMEILNEWNQTFVDAVRATGKKNATRFLGVASFYARCDLAVQFLRLPKDLESNKNRIMVSVHSYDPWNFAGAGKDSSWGHTGKFNMAGELECRNRVKSLYDTFVSKGTAVYMGECGAVNRSDSLQTAYQCYYMEYYAKAAADCFIPFILWDNGTNNKTGEEAFGYLNHGTGDYINQSKPFIDALVRAQTDLSVDYTLGWLYDNAPQ